MRVVITDGGRKAAGFPGNECRDCVSRSIAIVAELDYREVYEELDRRSEERAASYRGRRKRFGPAHDGVHREIYEAYLLERGFIWTPTMQVGKGCTVHLRASELPAGRLIVKCSKHLTAVIDHVIYDTHDPSRGGTRCVYGYYSRP